MRKPLLAFLAVSWTATAQEVEYLYGAKEVSKFETSLTVSYYQTDKKTGNDKPDGWNARLMIDYETISSFLRDFIFLYYTLKPNRIVN